MKMVMWHRFSRMDYLFVWLMLVVIGLFFRPLTPIDETRAVSVAWEMWLRHDFLVPHLNGQAYSHKPPLLQWGINLLWMVFGVQDWSARLVAPLFALGNLALTASLARRLWHADPISARLAPWFLLALPLWALWSSLTLYDMLVTFFTLIGLHGVFGAARGERAGWALVGAAIGGGVLAKGPVILLLILPVALLAPWWVESRPPAGWHRWYLGIIGAACLGALIALAWAVPAGIAGGEEYRRAIFWGQSAGRIANSFAHRRAPWWYLAMLPLLFFPWVFWPPLWRSAQRLTADAGLRFCGIHALSVLIVLSLISGKQAHYLLPMVPSVALFAARTLSHPPTAVLRRDQRVIALLAIAAGAMLLLVPPLLVWWGFAGSENQTVKIAGQAPLAAKLILIGCGAVLLLWRPGDLQAAVRGMALVVLGILFAAHLAYWQNIRPLHDLQPFADRLATAERAGEPIVHWRKYSGDFNFLGRLRNGLPEVATKAELLQWMRAHADGHVVVEYRPHGELTEDGAEFAQYYRGSRRLTVWKASELMARPKLLGKLIGRG
jgi:4-amino-4-deoxy-L-arabinose transferase-like glycosyltransferase